jgi:hypothetical protein
MYNITKDIDKLYAYAKRIGGELGCDLVHHVILLNLPPNIKDYQTYIKTCIRHEYCNPKSSFNKLYRPHYFEELNDIEDIQSISDNYDALLLHKIFLELEMEGYSTHVQVYKDCTLVSNKHQYSKNSKVNQRTIAKICKFVHNEIIRRYTELDLD